MLECEHDRFLQEDLDLIADSDALVDELKNSTVLVTGATGLVGSLLVKALACCNRRRGSRIQVLALVRSTHKARSVFGTLLDRGDTELIEADVTRPLEIQRQVNHVFHCASVTASRQMVEQPVETIMTAVLGTRNVLDLAARQLALKSAVYLSSMEMYGVFDGVGRAVTEKDLGYIDLSKVRSNYAESKRLCESLCVAYFAQHRVPVRIARLAQTFGAGVLPGENRVFAQFARCAMEGRSIVLHTHGRSEGNYCYTRDAVRALFTLAAKGVSGEAYNVSNEASHTTIADMARMVAKEIARGCIELEFDIPEANVFGYAPETHMVLNSGKLRALGWKPEVGLKEAYERLIGSLACSGH